jgi:hypothetical protein
LSGPNGAKAADAAYAIVERAAVLCDVALDRDAQPMRLRRQRVDLVQTARDAADLLASLAPEEFSFDIDHKASARVLAAAFCSILERTLAKVVVRICT